ncbi:undecaprenyl-phosphate glucose phosphotransferase [Massilia sp. Dwa41.01b]|uniref:undecaprenyl-phosphate glucose phosphotransferase n=1 Tax=unclassified Massilia TaxID=2609279 RepID=UPI001603AEDC|nr:MULTISPECIES: undecaprenyl-phosphate glucose phosphotransferase [unclassified Massilia]QNA88424.1 undecaprenyl-phosphate glucose phosphotransferase [Massilia sp. Dwa41.01b]QNA99319.1 undecaprenyl-phosphate glucose phosphotransferase [Massilia sp. Se16.2.3]
MTVNDIPLISFFQRVLDPLIIMGSLYLSSMAFEEPFSGYSLVLMILAFFISSAVYQHIDPYRTWRSGRMFAYARDTLFGWCVTIAVLYFLGSASGLKYYYDERVLLAWIIATPATLLGSHILVRRAAGAPDRSRELRSVVVVGANDVGVKFAGVCARHPHLFMQVHGFFDDRARVRHPASLRHPVLGAVAELSSYVRTHNIKLIFISQPISAQPRIRRLIDELQDTTASVYFLPDVYVFDLMQARFDNVGGMPVIAICETPFMGLNGMLKRLCDIVLSSVFLVLLAPLMLTIAGAVKASSPGPVIFTQRRYGLYGEEIHVYKFRSMRVLDDGNEIVQARRDDGRVTPIGRFLRRTSLDELPQFVNVLQGRMSIVGPRPHAVAHNEQYRKLIKGYMLRHKVKPGITGWAQVNGLRGETATLDKMEARVQYDLDYLRNWSVWLDLWIILKTIRVILTRENAF